MSPIKKKDSKKPTPPLHKINIMPRRPMSRRYRQIFFVHFYYCNNFGHKNLNCKEYRNLLSYNKNAPSNNPKERNLNSFLALQRYDLECYKCNNHGHVARECKLITHIDKVIVIMFQDKEHRKVWKKKEVVREGHNP